MKTPKYIDINYFTNKKAEEIKNKGGIILLGRIYDYKDGKLVRRECDKKEVDWKSVAEDYWKIIQDMSNRIKELENGKDREDKADSGAGVVAEEALQAHEE